MGRAMRCIVCGRDGAEPRSRVNWRGEEMPDSEPVCCDECDSMANVIGLLAERLRWARAHSPEDESSTTAELLASEFRKLRALIAKGRAA